MKKHKFKIDYILITFIIIFMVISISTIYSANTYLPSYLGNLALKQFIYYILGIILVFIIIKISNKNIYRFIDYLYYSFIILLFLLLFFGKSINGSKCWFVIPYIGSFQPSEFMKMILIIKISIDINKFFKKNHITIKDEFIFILKELVIIGIPSILTFLEPDTGAVIMYLISFLFIFIMAPFNKRWLIYGGITIISLICIVVFIYFFNKDLIIDLFGTDILYRVERIIDWRNKSGMQLENSLTSIGSSYLFGHGYNKTPLYFPESGTDFIFSVFTSNFGLIGSFILIIIICSFDLYIISKIKNYKSDINKFIIIGFLGLLLYQQCQNILMTLGVLPITGITLPFISYGGSSLISYFFMIGIIFNINNQEKIQPIN